MASYFLKRAFAIFRQNAIVQTEINNLGYKKAATGKAIFPLTPIPRRVSLVIRFHQFPINHQTNF
jgi:hypothetical protein